MFKATANSPAALGSTWGSFGVLGGGKSSDPRTQAALTFALKVVRAHAAVTDADVAALKAAGFGDEAEPAVQLKRVA